MKNFKWGTKSFDESPINVVLFVSRNKDNKGVKDFVERRKSFITHEPIYSAKLEHEFINFVKEGMPGELSRMYYSVNERNPEKIHKILMHFLIDNPDFNLCAIDSKLAGIAANKECALTKRWMFDFDIKDKEKVLEFCNDIEDISSGVDIKSDVNVEVHETPNGYAVITDRGFDIRKLLEKWGNDVTLKRDDLLCYRWFRLSL